MNGLSIANKEFESLPIKQQVSLLYQNTEDIKEMLIGFKFQQKIQWVAIGILFIIAGFGKYLGVL